jgi:hypothetical protein
MNYGIISGTQNKMNNGTQKIQKVGTCPTCGGSTRVGKIHNDYKGFKVEFCYACDKYIHRDAQGRELQPK